MSCFTREVAEDCPDVFALPSQISHCHWNKRAGAGSVSVATASREITDKSDDKSRRQRPFVPSPQFSEVRVVLGQVDSA